MRKTLVGKNNLAPKFVQGGKIKSIILEDKASDIAYVLYDPKETLGAINIEFTNFVKELPKTGDPLVIVGFPAQEDIKNGTLKVISESCQFTGTSGIVPPSPDSTQIDGTVYGTNCGGYWGVSGGPVFSVESATGLFTKLVGVVSHTFALLQDGSLDQTKIKLDKYGQYIGY